MKAPVPENEKERLEALQRYQIMDSLSEIEFDAITKLASTICNVPIALISLVDENRQWFKSKVGLPVDETPREISFCQHAILDNKIYEVSDATKSKLFASNPLVLNDPNIRFYAGAPLIDGEGFALGTLCVIDRVPKILTEDQRKSLEALATEVVALLTLRKSKKVLEDSKNEMEAMLLGLQEGIVFQNLAGEIVRCNASAERILGLTYDQMIGKKSVDPTWRAIHEDGSDFPGNTHPAMVTLATGEQLTNVIMGVHKPNDELTWISINSVPLFDKDTQKLSGVICTFNDITDTKKSNDKVKRNEEMLEKSQHLAQMCSWELDFKTKKLTWSKEYLNIFDLEEGEYDGNNHDIFWKKFVGKDAKVFADTLENCLKARIGFELEYRIADKKGEVKYLNGKGDFEFDETGRRRYFRGTVQDITKIKEAQRLLQDSDNRWKFAVESAGDGIWDMDLKTQTAYQNDQFLENLGFVRGEIQFTHQVMLEMVHPDDREKFDQAFHDLVGNHKESFAIEYQIKCKNGKYKWIFDRAKVIERDEAGNPTRIIGVHLDLTERKQQEKEIQINEERLREAQEIAKVGSWEFDLLTSEQYWSSEHYRIFEIEEPQPQEILHAMYRAKIHPDDLVVLDRVIEEAITLGKDFEYNHRVLLENGGIRYVVGIGKVIFDAKNKPAKLKGTVQDVTDRVLKDQELKASEERLNEAQKLSKIGNWEFDFKTQALFWSDELFNVFDIPADTPIHELHEVYRSKFTAEELVVLDEKVAACITTGEPYENFHAIAMENGTKRYIHGRGFARKNVHGEIVAIFGTAQDVTKKKRQEDLKSIIADVSSGFLENVDSMNRTFTDILTTLLEIGECSYGFIGEVQYEENVPFIKSYAVSDTDWDISTQNYFELLIEKDHEFKNLNNAFGRVLDERKLIIINDEKSLKSETASFHDHLELHSFMGIPVMHNDKLVGIIALGNKSEPFEEEDCKFLKAFTNTLASVIHSVKAENKRKLAEESVVKIKNELQNFFDLSYDFMAIASVDGTFKSVNHTFMKALGYEESEFLNVPFVSFVHPDDVDATVHEVNKLSQGLLTVDFENRFFKKDGTYVWLSWRTAPDLVTGNLYATARDVTAEREIKETLILAKEKAEHASMAKSEFLANMSHEIRTPLNGILGFSELMKTTDLDAIQETYSNTIMQSAHSLLAVINDILDFSKIEAGKFELDVHRANLCAISAEAIDIVTYQAQSKNLELILNLDTNLPKYFQLDSTRLKQIFINLLGNAIKFTTEGEVELHIELLDKVKDKVRIRFSVRDTGVGIKDSQKKLIFEAFSQADNSTTRKFGGTGLGLSISNKLLGLMGNSQLNVTSKLGKGSTFYFDLELNYEYSEEDDFEFYGDNKALIVEDSLFSGNVLKKYLEVKKIQADVVTNYKDAIDLILEGTKYNIMFINSVFDRLDGINVIEKIVNQTKIDLSKIITILMSKSIENNTMLEKCAKYGVTDKILKPIKPQTLFELLKMKRMREKVIEYSSHSKIISKFLTKANHILIVDDNEINLMLASTLIRQILPNVTVSFAEDGEKAIECYKKDSPFIIFMDLQMPIMNGFEATIEIRKLNKDIPIIALTANEDMKEKEQCLKLGMDAYLSKPMSKSDIEVLIHQFILRQAKTTM